MPDSMPPEAHVNHPTTPSCQPESPYITMVGGGSDKGVGGKKLLRHQLSLALRRPLHLLSALEGKFPSTNRPYPPTHGHMPVVPPPEHHRAEKGPLAVLGRPKVARLAPARAASTPSSPNCSPM